MITLWCLNHEMKHWKKLMGLREVVLFELTETALSEWQSKDSKRLFRRHQKNGLNRDDDGFWWFSFVGLFWSLHKFKKYMMIYCDYVCFYFSFWCHSVKFHGFNWKMIYHFVAGQGKQCSSTGLGSFWNQISAFPTSTALNFELVYWILLGYVFVFFGATFGQKKTRRPSCWTAKRPASCGKDVGIRGSEHHHMPWLTTRCPPCLLHPDANGVPICTSRIVASAMAHKLCHWYKSLQVSCWIALDHILFLQVQLTTVKEKMVCSEVEHTAFGSFICGVVHMMPTLIIIMHYMSYYNDICSYTWNVYINIYDSTYTVWHIPCIYCTKLILRYNNTDT